MASKYQADVSQSCESARTACSTTNRIILSGVDVVRDGRAEPFLDSRPIRSSAPAQWGGIALENYNTVPAVFIPRHEHPEHFLHLVLSGAVKYEVGTKGKISGLLHVPAHSFFCLGVPWMECIGRAQLD